ncbi:MAG: DUF2946 domain-containing protein [Burkholderiales bacterium]|nr:DUF2946 domain-containing protein [Burkholderiales bacterium]
MLAYDFSRRCFRTLTRTVLLLYVLTLGVAMASSVLHPKSMDLVCTSTGYKLIAQADSGESGAAQKSHLLDCSLCLAGGLAPPLPQTDAGAAPHALSYALRAIPAARLAAVVAAPLPARGPPALN